MRLLIVDGASLAYRSYYALAERPLINSKGIKTGAPYTFLNSYLKLVRELKPSHVVVVFDAKGKTFRHELFAEYKAQRPKAPPDFKIQLSYIKEILDALNVKRLEIPGVEADDVIATLSKKAERDGFEVFVATMDKDLYQLVTEKVKIVETKDGVIKIIGEQEVIEKFGVKPSQIPDLLALIGDKIDNIPNIPGIGEKTGSELIRNYGGVAGILESKESRDVISKIKYYRDQILNTLELVKLRDDLSLDINYDEFKLKDFNRERFFRVLGELEFYSIMAEFALKPEVSVTEVSTVPFDFLSADTISVEYDNKDTFFISKDPSNVYKLKKDKVLPFLKNFTGKIVTFESKKLFKICDSLNVGFDVILSSFLLNSDRPKFDDESVTLEYTGFGLGISPEERLANLCALNLYSYKVLEKELAKRNLWNLLVNLEIPFQKVLADMEKTGIKIDISKLLEIEKKLNEELKKKEKEIYELAGTPFNINSPKQLSEILFSRLKLKPVKRTKTGYSTDEESLRKLADVHPLPGAILSYREIFKIKTTYVDSFLELVDRASGRIYPVFNQVGAATGRISCLNPNFQTLPVKSTIGRDLRDVITAEEGYKILAADYSQIELRILAHFSGDKRLIEVFEEDLDVHAITASYIFNKPLQEITDSERRKAKTVNFGIIYGISPYGLAKELGIEVGEAEKLIKMFFAIYPGVLSWIERNLEFAEKSGYVKTLMGRVRYVPGLASPDISIAEQARRIAINTPIQGTVADIMKLAMIKIYNELKGRGLKSKIILQIHDEILMEVKIEEEEFITRMVKDIMETVYDFAVPLKVSIGTGRTWLAASNK
ncbi:MAG: DNA polymerase I [candidate division WOR-3 bacterium]